MKSINKEIQLNNGSIILRPYRSSDVDAVHEIVTESQHELRDQAIEVIRFATKIKLNLIA